MIWFVSADFDDAQFADPYRFDVGRTPNPHVAFGLMSPHLCLGAQLARMEIKVLLEELLPRSDFVTLHVNLSPVTRHMINAETLALMKPTAVLVNTSRGPVIDQAALAEALRNGVIAAAALDVTDPEPIAMDDPLVGMDNCLVVPHIASASRATRGKMAEMAAANLVAGVRGEPLPTEVAPPA